MIPITKKRFPKKIIIVTSIVTVLALGAVAYVYAFNGDIFGWNAHNNGPSKNIPATDEQKKAGDEIKKNNLKTSKPNAENDDSNQGTTPPTSSGKRSVDVIITAAAQNGSTFQVRADIGTITDTGTCTLVLTRGGASVTKTATIQAMANSSTCRGFDVPVSEFSPGQWQLVLSFENNQSAGSASKTIEIN